MSEHFIGQANAKGYFIISLRTDSGYPECSSFKITGEGTVDVSVQKMTVSDDAFHHYIAYQKA